ncbi:MAG: tetratricopeptide repeat protein [Chloracidobacterium sp.]|nr:tetratricopeptide repeat protein [Chloracidobacterium sp.]MDW8216493.1 tetratricopeptide repeat protein [Acidobacteriota bacterium]
MRWTFSFQKLPEKNPTLWRSEWWWLVLVVGWLWADGCLAEAAVQSPADPAVRVITLFEAGQDAHQAGKLTEALALYEQALALDDALAPVHFQRGMALLALQRPTEAVAAFERCVTLQPDFPHGWARLGAAAVAAGDAAKAEQALTKALEQNPEDAQTRRQLARLALLRDAPAAALDRLGPLDAADPEANLLRGTALFQMGRFADAVAAFSRTLTREPSHIEARRRRGDAYAAQGDLERALADWRTAYAAAPESELAGDIVSALLQLNRTDAARDFLKTARATFPTDARLVALEAEIAGDAALTEATHLLRAGRFSEAVAAYVLLVERAPEAVAPRAGLATALFKLGRFDEAVRHFDILRRKQPEVAATYFFLGVCYDKMGDYRTALAAYEAFLARANGVHHRLEIEKIQLRLPSLKRQAEQSKPREP